jgi:hypothetical protein
MSSGMLRRVALVRTDVSEELSASIRVTRIGELGTTLAVTSSPILVTLMKEALSSSETSVFTRATRRNIPEHTILHSHRSENLKSYMCLLDFNSIFKYTHSIWAYISSHYAKRRSNYAYLPNIITPDNNTEYFRLCNDVDHVSG